MYDRDVGFCAVHRPCFDFGLCAGRIPFAQYDDVQTFKLCPAILITGRAVEYGVTINAIKNQFHKHNTVIQRAALIAFPLLPCKVEVALKSKR